jgi:hypothetical protein
LPCPFCGAVPDADWVICHLEYCYLCRIKQIVNPNAWNRRA